MTELDTGALEGWLRRSESDHLPANGFSVLHSDVEAATSDELAKIRRDLALKRGRAELQRDPAWLDVLSPVEKIRERAAAKKIRGMRRDQHVSVATSSLRLAGRERTAEQRLARYELSDRLWQRRALARRTRLMDPTSRLASLQRTHVVVTAVLQVLAVAGIAWTSIGVHDALVGPGGSPMAYIVEPLFSVPLLVLMAVTGRAAQWGRKFPDAEHRRTVYALEAALLTATVLVNTSPVLPGLGTWKDVTTLLAHLAPPALIVVAVILQPLVAAFLAGILSSAHVDAPDPGGRRLTVETVNVLSMVSAVQAAAAANAIPLWEDTGLPSVSEIARYFGCEKRKAQGAHDALKMLQGGGQFGGPAGEAR
jgi:hypothetical protein